VVTALTGMLQIWVASEHTIRTAEFCRPSNQIDEANGPIAMQFQ
jgi:hypothetical protein